MSSSPLHTSDDALAYGAALLVSDRVRLRPVVEDDLDTLAEWWARTDWAVLQQQTALPRPGEAVKEMFRGWSKNEGSGVGLSIELTDGTLIGHATLYGAVLPHRVGTYAIIIGPEHTGQGYGTEVTRMMLRYAFEELGVNKVELQAWAFNTYAISSYEKAGFVREGVLRARAFHAGEFHDQVMMGVLAQEWRAGRNE